MKTVQGLSETELSLAEAHLHPIAQLCGEHLENQVSKEFLVNAFIFNVLDLCQTLTHPATVEHQIGMVIACPF